jgi:hypothetical protein
LELDWKKLTSLGNGLGKIYKSWKWTGKINKPFKWTGKHLQVLVLDWEKVYILEMDWGKLQVLEMDWEKCTSLGIGLGKIYKSDSECCYTYDSAWGSRINVGEVMHTSFHHL